MQEDALQLGTYTYSADQNPNDIQVGQYEIINVNNPTNRRITVRPHADNAADFASRWHTGFKFKIGDNVTITLRELNGITPHYYTDAQAYRGYYDIEGTLPSTGTASAWTVPGVLVHSSDLATVAKTGNYSDLHNKPTIPMDTDIYEGVWSATKTYSSGKMVSRSGSFYISKQDSNLNHDPSTDTSETWWDKLGVGAPDDVTSVTRSGDIVTVTKRDNTTTTISLSKYVNPEHVTPTFRTEDGSSANNAGLTFFIKSDNTQWQSGSSTQVAAIEINHTQFTTSQNPQIDNAGNTGWHSLPEDISTNRGTTIWTFQRLQNSSPFAPVVGSVITVQADTIVKNDDGNYVLQNLTHLEGFSQSGTGYNWQVVGSFAPPTSATEIVGDIDWSKLSNIPARVGTFTAADEKIVDDAITKSDLVEKETDKYASYTNAFFGSGYRTGSFCFYTQDTVPTNDDNAVRQPDIADRNTNGVIAFGATLRSDRNPNNFVCSTDRYCCFIFKR